MNSEGTPVSTQDEFARQLESFDTRLRLQEKVVTELFESVRTLNKSVQSLEQSNEKRIAVDEALKGYIEGLRSEQRDQQASFRSDRSIWQTNRGFYFACASFGLLMLLNVIQTFRP